MCRTLGHTQSDALLTCCLPFEPLNFKWQSQKSREGTVQRWQFCAEPCLSTLILLPHACLALNWGRLQPFPSIRSTRPFFLLTNPWEIPRNNAQILAVPRDANG